MNKFSRATKTGKKRRGNGSTEKNKTYFELICYRLTLKPEVVNRDSIQLAN